MKSVFKFHNDVKREIINTYAGENLLDLASGRGGDLHKWISNKKIKKVIGYDINEKSVSEAKKRLLGFNTKKDITFFVKDLSKETVFCDYKKDLITCNFAFHYFFKNKDSLDKILKSIDNCSKKGTYFSCTLFDGDIVLESENLESFKNHYIIKKIDKEYPKNKIYDKKISVYIKNSILDIPETEYLVRSSHLVRKMKSINFELVKSEPIIDIAKKLKYTNFTKEEESFVKLNRSYIFRKVK